jgi:hypothetical protein
MFFYAFVGWGLWAVVLHRLPNEERSYTIKITKPLVTGASAYIILL